VSRYLLDTNIILRATAPEAEPEDPRAAQRASGPSRHCLGCLARVAVRLLPTFRFREANGHRGVSSTSRRLLHRNPALRRTCCPVACCRTRTPGIGWEDSTIRERADRRRSQDERPRPRHPQPDGLRWVSGPSSRGLARVDSFTCRFHHNATLQCYPLPVVTESVTNLDFTPTVDQVVEGFDGTKDILTMWTSSTNRA
jgi:hypothetical protein